MRSVLQGTGSTGRLECSSSSSSKEKEPGRPPKLASGISSRGAISHRFLGGRTPRERGPSALEIDSTPLDMHIHVQLRGQKALA